ncbi:Putative aminoacrylate hydrolase RutD [Caulifigura coniformis]|uniref:Aminoacrylate hydrolase RutD n=1 Tax=Caulifigura coniformis TaxID=2527983 RepID=A0A517S8N3_9PLAN|nr:alpha/beta hydrolase [Caulifigura coniformis]QDT52473.1 Putative aminoacrylate hydrolase RutD [Caulifigura coniformis]
MSDPSLASENPPAPEACPPPLAWQEVLQGVEEQGESFTHSGPGIELNGIAIGEGPPLWFLGGLAGDRRLYSLIAWLMRDRFRCLVADASCDTPPSPAALVASVADAFVGASHKLELDRPAYFGTSFGGQIALAILERHPDHARAAILHEAFACRRVSLTERLMAWGAGKSSKLLREFPSWGQIQEANHRRWFPPIDPSRWNFLLDSLGETSARHWSVLARGAAATDLGPALHTIKAPVLLLRTEGDGPVATRAVNELMVSLPDVREETLHTSGHFAFLTHPHRVAKIVAGFINGTP